MSAARDLALGQLLDTLQAHERPQGTRILLSEPASTALRRWWSAPRAGDPSPRLGTRMRQERERQGLTQTEVARRIGGRSQGQLSRWEAGEGPLPDAGELGAWLDALCVEDGFRVQALADAHADHAARTPRRR